MDFLVKMAEWSLGQSRNLRAKRKAAAISGIELSKSLSGHMTVKDFLYEFRYGDRPQFLFSSSDIEFFKTADFADKDAIIKDADIICRHEFDLLGSGRTDANGNGGKIDWHRDFKSGVRWEPNVFFTEIPFIKGSGSDIKVPWEISRFQHLPTLGKAYWLTNNEKYALEFVNEISDWIDNNAPLYGVNWACTMEVAIRAVNWIWALHFFKSCPVLTDDFLLKLLNNLLIHGKFIRQNLERSAGIVEFVGCTLINKIPLVDGLKRSWQGVTTNHYLSDIVGLLYLGIVFPDFKQAAKWRDFGIKELVREMRKQIYSDGVNYEGSTSYHRLDTELFLSASLLCLKQDFSFPDWYMQRLENMIEFVMYYIKPDGTTPQIGDNDDGRLHILADYGNWDRLDHRYLLAVGAVLFNRPDFKQAAGGFYEEAFWLLGATGLKRFDEVLAQQESYFPSKDFPRGGFYFMRNESLYLVESCTTADHVSPSGHKHNSNLSFELFAYDKSFVVDPGTYVYTSDRDMRNLFRSTRYHNTVVVDSEEQNRFDENKFFTMGHCAGGKVNLWESVEEYDVLDIEYYGYKRLKNPVVHRRIIVLDKRLNYWTVRDILSGKGSHYFDLYFHLAPLEVELDAEFPLAVRTRSEGANLAIIPLNSEGVSVEIENGWVSFQYGVKRKAPVVRYRKKSRMPTSFCTVIYPYEAEIDIKEVMGGCGIGQFYTNGCPGEDSSDHFPLVSRFCWNRTARGS